MKKLLLLFPMLLILLGVDNVYANNQFNTDANNGSGTVLTVKPDQDSGWPGPYGMRVTLVYSENMGGTKLPGTRVVGSVSVDYTNFTGLSGYRHFDKASRIERMSGPSSFTTGNLLSTPYIYKKMSVPLPAFVTDSGIAIKDLVNNYFYDNFNPTNNLERLTGLLTDLKAPPTYIDNIKKTYLCQKQQDNPSCDSSTDTIRTYKYHMLVEPIGFIYLKANTKYNKTANTVWVAGTATELALLMNSATGSYSESGWVAGFTHNNLPKSIYISKDYYGKLTGVTPPGDVKTRLPSSLITGSQGFGVGVIELIDYFPVTPPKLKIDPVLQPATCPAQGQFRDFEDWDVIVANTTVPSLRLDIPNSVDFINVYCRQELTTKFPGEIFNVKSGTHLPLEETMVGGSKECRAYIDVNKWRIAYNTANTRVKDTFDIYMKKLKEIEAWENKYDPKNTGITKVSGCVTSAGNIVKKELSCTKIETVPGTSNYMRSTVSYKKSSTAPTITTLMPPEKTHATTSTSPIIGSAIDLVVNNGRLTSIPSYIKWKSIAPRIGLVYNLCTFPSGCPTFTNPTLEVYAGKSCALQTKIGTNYYLIGSDTFNNLKIPGIIDPAFSLLTYGDYIKGRHNVVVDESNRYIYSAIRVPSSMGSELGTGVYFYQTYKPTEACPINAPEQTIYKPKLTTEKKDYEEAVKILEKVIEQLKTSYDGWSTTFTQKPELKLEFTETASGKRQNYDLVPTTTTNPLIESATCRSSIMCTQKALNTLVVYKNVCSTSTENCVQVDISDSQIEPYLFTKIIRSQSQRIDYSLPSDANRYVDKATGIPYTWATLPATVKANRSYVDIGYANIPVSYDSHVNTPVAGQIKIAYRYLGEKTASGAYHFDSMSGLSSQFVGGYLRYACDWTPMVPGELSYVYRPIDLKDPFPGYTAVKREPGANWTTDPLAITRKITFNRGVADEAIYTNRTPIFRIDFTGANRTVINKIRAYNKTRNYDYTELVCNGVDIKGNNNGTQCKSRFLTSITMRNDSGKSIVSGCGTSTNWTNCPGTE
jgi:hypothetical protein